MVWAFEAAWVWLVVFACAAAGWAVGFGMGYRRGVNDAKTGDIIKAGYRMNAD